MLECNATECCSCGKEFAPPDGYLGYLCTECFMGHRWKFDSDLVAERSRARRDKKTLDYLVSLPYSQRMDVLTYRYGRPATYPPDYDMEDNHHASLHDAER